MKRTVSNCTSETVRSVRKRKSVSFFSLISLIRRLKLRKTDNYNDLTETRKAKTISSVSWTVVFYGKQRGNVCKDIRADGNIIRSKMVDEIIGLGVAVDVSILNRHSEFDLALPNRDGASAQLEC